MYDVIVVGAGVSGLSAALVLGRARRRVLVLDGGSARNAPAEAAHGYFTRDGTPPLELLRIGREQLRPYATVELRQAEATAATRTPDGPDGFEVALTDGESVNARKLVLATGVVDQLPEIPGFRELWARGVYHCPYCHGWEVRDLPLAVYADGEIAMHMAPLIRNWSRAVVLLTGGPSTLSVEQRATLARLDIPLVEAPVSRLEQLAGERVRVLLDSGGTLDLGGVFVYSNPRPRNALALQLGCALIEDGWFGGLVKVDESHQTTVPGVYAVGDVATPMQQLVSAAAHGATAAAMLNHALVQEEVQAVVAP